MWCFLLTICLLATPGQAGPVPMSLNAAWLQTYLLNSIWALETVSTKTPTPQQELRLHAAAVDAKVRLQPLPTASAPTTTQPNTLPIATVVAEQMAGNRWEKHWSELKLAYDLSAPTCLESVDPTALLGLAAKPNTSAQQLKAAYAATENAECTLLKAVQTANSAAATAKLANALRQQPNAPKRILDLALVVSYLQQNEFPEALRTTLEIADYDSNFHMVYEFIQRIFTQRQRGDGAVSLRGF
jgi:hypothetical protein